MGISNTLLLGVVQFQTQFYWATLHLFDTNGKQVNVGYLNKEDEISQSLCNQIQNILIKLEYPELTKKIPKELSGGKIVYQEGGESCLSSEAKRFWNIFTSTINHPNLIRHPIIQLNPLGEYQSLIPKILEKLDEDKPLEDEEERFLSSLMEGNSFEPDASQLQLLLEQHLRERTPSLSSQGERDDEPLSTD